MAPRLKCATRGARVVCTAEHSGLGLSKPGSGCRGSQRNGTPLEVGVVGEQLLQGGERIVERCA